MKARRACLALGLLALGAVVLAHLHQGNAAAAPRPLGIDVSRFDHAIDWASVASSGVSFAFIEASRGTGDDCAVKPAECGADPLYATNYAGARAAGLRVGAYERAFASGPTVAEARADAAAEAELFIAQVGQLHAGDLLPVLDVETPFNGLNPDRLRVWIRAWMKRVRARLGARAIIYTNATSWQATGNTSEFAAGHPLWIANFGVSRPSVPAANWGGRRWSIWQFTSSGAVPGIPGRVDEDRLKVRLGKLSVK
jgi:GH25 family lysozyme M1 (1,4-beta-N-acetylmuramidase)